MVKSFSKLSPRIVNTLFLVLIQEYFKYHPEYPYDSDDSKTMMDIAADFDEEDYKQKAMPVIVVQNGGIAIEPAGIGTGLSYAAPRVEVEDGHVYIKDGLWDKQLQFICNCSTTIRILTMSKDDADELAFELAMFLQMVRYKIGPILQIQNIGSPQIQTGQPIGQNGWANKYAAMVMVPYTFTITREWKPVDFGEPLRAIGFDLVAPKVAIKDDNTLEEKDPEVILNGIVGESE